MAAPRSSRPEPISNRTVALGAVALVVILLLGILIVVLSGDDTPTGGAANTVPATVTTPDGSVVPGGERPSSIPLPSQGKGPTDAGDPGGAEQLILFGLLMLSVGGIGFMIFRGGKKTRANRALWLAAAEQPEPPATSPMPPSTDDPVAEVPEVR